MTKNEIISAIDLDELFVFCDTKGAHDDDFRAVSLWGQGLRKRMVKDKIRGVLDRQRIRMAQAEDERAKRILKTTDEILAAIQKVRDREVLEYLYLRTHSGSDAGVVRGVPDPRATQIARLRKALKDLATSHDGIMIREARTEVEGDLFPPAYSHPSKWISRVSGTHGIEETRTPDTIEALVECLESMSREVKERDK